MVYDLKISASEYYVETRERILAKLSKANWSMQMKRPSRLRIGMVLFGSSSLFTKWSTFMPKRERATYSASD